MATKKEKPQVDKKKKPTKPGKQKRRPLGPKRPATKKKFKQKNELKHESKNKRELKSKDEESPTTVDTFQVLYPDDQRMFFLSQFESANSIKLSSLELDSIKDTFFVKLMDGINQDASNIGSHIKDTFGSSWKEVLCENQLIEGKIEPGSPAVLVVSASAIRSLELLRGLRALGKECQVVKLFSKHIKIDDQVELLKNRVNVGSGTPSRIKKLFEIEALVLSRLEVIVLDMHADVKGYSLLTLPQVRDEFWDLYKNYFHQRLVEGNLRVCLYGPIPTRSRSSMKKICRSVTD